MLGLKLNHVSKRGPRNDSTQVPVVVNQITHEASKTEMCRCFWLSNYHDFNNTLKVIIGKSMATSHNNEIVIFAYYMTVLYSGQIVRWYAGYLKRSVSVYISHI